MATTKKTSSTIPGMTGELPSLADLTKLAEQFKLPGVDVSALVEWQRKDLEALAEANRQAYEGMKALAQRQAEILRENLSEWQGAMQGAVSPDALAKQSDAAKRGVQQAIDNFRELAAMETETRTNAWKVVQDRMQENMANLQKLMQGKK